MNNESLKMIIEYLKGCDGFAVFLIASAVISTIGYIIVGSFRAIGFMIHGHKPPKVKEQKNKNES